MKLQFLFVSRNKPINKANCKTDVTQNSEKRSEMRELILKSQ